MVCSIKKIIQLRLKPPPLMDTCRGFKLASYSSDITETASACEAPLGKNPSSWWVPRGCYRNAIGIRGCYRNAIGITRLVKNVPFWGFFEHHQSPNICWRWNISPIYSWVMWNITGHRNQPLYNNKTLGTPVVGAMFSTTENKLKELLGSSLTWDERRAMPGYLVKFHPTWHSWISENASYGTMWKNSHLPCFFFPRLWTGVKHHTTNQFRS